MQNFVERSALTLGNEKAALSISQLIQHKLETWSWPNYLALFYIILVILWLIKLLKNLVVPTNEQFLLKLHKATDANDIHEINNLLNKNPKAVNSPLGKEGFTPFLKACFNGNTELVKIMLQFGADISSQTIREENAFYLAVYGLIKNISNHDARCIQALYYAGVDINKPNIKGINALQMASMYGHSGLVDWLLNKGAKLNVCPHPYTLAKRAGYKDTASLLKRKVQGL